MDDKKEIAQLLTFLDRRIGFMVLMSKCSATRRSIPSSWRQAMANSRKVNHALLLKFLGPFTLTTWQMQVPECKL